MCQARLHVPLAAGLILQSRSVQKHAKLYRADIDNYLRKRALPGRLIQADSRVDRFLLNSYMLRSCSEGKPKTYQVAITKRTRKKQVDY